MRNTWFLLVNNAYELCVYVFFVVGVVRPISRTPLGELQRSNAPIDRMYK